MQYRRLVIFLSLLLFSISIFAQDKHPFDCENFRVGQTYTGQQLTIRLRTIKKDFEIYSVYGYFDKSLEVLNSQLESYGVAQKEREQIIKQIRKMTGWSGKKLQEYGLKEPQNSELISIFNHFDFTNFTQVDPLTVKISLNRVIEKYLSKEKAKEVIEGLLEKNFNCKCAVSYLEDNFCFYQRAGTLIEEYGSIDKSFKDYRVFLKDYLGKCSIGK